MKRNLATWERAVRILSASAMIGYAAFGALSTMASVALVTAGLYLIGTSLAGTCLGYRMLGISTCPVAANREVT